MQGQRGAIGSLPESFTFDHGSASTDAGIVDQQNCWNNNSMRNNPPNRLSDYMSPTSATDLYMNSTSQEGQNSSVWSMGEASSSSMPNPVSQSHTEPKTEHGWPSLMKPCPEPHQYEPQASMLSLGDVNMNVTRSQASNSHHGPLFVQSSRPESATHNVTVNPSTFISMKPSNPSEAYRGSAAGGSSSSSIPFGPSSDPFESEGHRMSHKRKAMEISGGQSSSASGSSNMFQRPESSPSMWHETPENPIPASAPSDQIIPRLGLGVGVSSENTPVENTHRNVRLRINASRQQDPLPTNNNSGQSNISSPYPSLRLNPVDLRTPPVAATAENPSSHQGSPGLRMPILRRNLQSSSRWSRSSSSRASRSSNIVISGDRDEFNSRTMPTNISDHPIFVQPSETRNVSQNAINWSLNGGDGTAGTAGSSVASSSRASSSTGPTPSSTAPNWVSHRGSPHYPSRRLTEYLRRSLLASDDAEAGGVQNSNGYPRVLPSSRASAASSQDAGIPPVGGVQGGHHLSHSRSALLVDRQLEGAFAGFPYLSRSMAAGSEGRGRLVSEIRNVLDLMRRGEGLRFEDVMILDQSVFYGMADIHDRHRDMRLDIDNMSYEELLALEERIGNVNTGLTEETISNHLKQKKYATITGQPDAEPCCICQEEYNEGDDLGALECGHDFHSSCIKKWLLHKNLCPICKSTAYAAT